MSHARPAEELINRVLPYLQHDKLRGGLAGLRFWGQTKERSAAWIAAADPVYLETTLSSLRVHAFGEGDVDSPQLTAILNSLQDSLGGKVRSAGRDEGVAFARLGDLAYLRSDEFLATAAVSADIADGCEIGAFIPDGEGSDHYHRLLSELQMMLHEHDVNRSRESTGKRPVNSLWIWGGGVAPQKDIRPILPLFGDDPIFKGYWESCTGVIEKWTGKFAQCLDLAVGGFVVITPDARNTRDAAGNDRLADYLRQLREHLRRGHINQLTLLFRDGLCVEISRFDLLKFWRRRSPFLIATTTQ